MEAVAANMAARAELTFCRETSSVVCFHLIVLCREDSSCVIVQHADPDSSQMSSDLAGESHDLT